jgi:hypothetical protein
MPRYKVGTGQVASASSSLLLTIGQTQTFQAGLYDSNDNPIAPDPGTAQWTSTDGGKVLTLSFSVSSPSQCSVTAVAAGSSTLEYNADFSGQPYSAQFAISVP